MAENKNITTVKVPVSDRVRIIGESQETNFRFEPKKPSGSANK